MAINLISDPPPLVVFEFDESGVTAVRRDSRTLEIAGKAERAFAPGVLDVSAAHPNIRDMEAVEQAVEEILVELGPLPRPEAAVILPDGASRLTLLDFADLPSKAEDRLALLKFRLAKSVPFDIDSARIAYHVEKKVDGRRVFIQALSEESVRQYERVLERFDLWPGYVGGSTVNALNLLAPEGMTLFAKLSDRTLTMAAVDGGRLLMIRTVETALSAAEDEHRALRDLTADLYPTLVFIADTLGTPADHITMAGFGELLAPALRELPGDLGCELEPLRSPFGPIGPREAGLWGYVSQGGRA
jgi:type IV pilus assembly protein PilM